MSNTSIAVSGDRASGQGERGGLISPVADFLMVGGLSVILAFVTVVMPASILGEYSNSIIKAAFLMAFVINYPHFMHSYQIFYSNLGEKLFSRKYGVMYRLRHWIAALVVPLALGGFLFYASQRPGSGLLGYGANIMFFFVGWHYAKQGYGIFIMMSARRKIFYEPAEKWLFLINAYTVWVYTWLHANTYIWKTNYYDISYSTFGMTTQAAAVAGWAVVVMGAICAIILYYKHWAIIKMPSITGLVGYISALYLWMVFARINVFMIYFVPAFHSLQYLPFSWKLEYEKVKEERGHTVADSGRLSWIVKRDVAKFIVIGLAAGALFFEFIPKTLDHYAHYDRYAFGGTLYLFIFVIFLNVHHYFIDFAIWRRDNPELKYLLR